MGIRFHCPNGHKLNVKSELAGRRAICPECGARLLVPVESAVTANGGRSKSTSRPTPELSKIASRRFAPAGPVATPEIVAPAAVWYVRPRSGGQYGPATEEVFRMWIADGRVAADAHVWRDGWSDWKLVRDAAGELPAPLEAIPAGTGSAGAWPVVGTAVDQPTEPPKVAVATSPALPAVGEDAVKPGSRYLANRKRANKQQMTLAMLMLAAVVVLAAVLAWVLMRGDSPAPATTQSRATPLENPHASPYAAREIGSSPGEVLAGGNIFGIAKDEWLS